LDKLYQTWDADLLACHIANFPLVNFTNRASDTFREVMADIKAGYDESIHPKLFELYKDNYHKGLSMFGEPEPGSRYFELHEKFKLNTARLASYKSYKVTKLLKDLPEKDFDKNALQVLKNFNRYQATEYNAIVSRARSAKQFIDFQGDADLYPNMEWIMTRSANPREAHLALVGTIRPINDPFWNENQPGNLWNCKCDWQPTDKEVTGVPKQVVKPATGLDGNPAMTGELITTKHPYISKTPKNTIDDIMSVHYRDTVNRYPINVLADKSEVHDNVATGRVLLNNFPKIDIRIREHILDGRSNPEFEIDKMLADAKRIEGYSGISTGFKKAVNKQNCKIVIIDFNKHFRLYNDLDIMAVSRAIRNRRIDFEDNRIERCYLVFGDKAVMLSKNNFDINLNKEQLKEKLYDAIKVLNPIKE